MSPGPGTQPLLGLDGRIGSQVGDVPDVVSGDVGPVTIDSLQLGPIDPSHQGDQMSCITTRPSLDSDPMDHEGVGVYRCVEGREPPSPRPLEPDSLPLAPGGVREPGGIHRDPPGRGTSPGNGLVQSVKAMGLQSFQRSVEEGVTGWSLQPESMEEFWLKGQPRHEITITHAGIEFESEEDKQHREGKLHWSAIARPDIRNGIAKAHKFLKQEVKAASFGRFV